MIGNASVHVAIMLAAFSGSAERPERKASSSIGRGVVSEASESVERGHEQADSVRATNCDSGKTSVATGSVNRFEPFAGTFNAELKLWTGRGDPIVSTGVMTNTLVLRGR